MEQIPAPVSYKFERIEKKFWMSASQYSALLPVLENHMTQDAYGTVPVCNIYYDTKDFQLIRRSIERPLFKEKLRLRSYGIPTENDTVFVEIKRKLNGIGYKRRISVPFSQAKALLRGESIECDSPQIERELEEFVRRYHPQPVVYLMYRRFAMTDPDNPELRVTFDSELRYRTENPDQPSAEGMQPFTEDDSAVLMEIKALDGIPLWLVSEMSRLGIRQAPFSKIGACYTRRIAPARTCEAPA